MAGRLSETQLTSMLDTGHKSLPWEPSQPSGFLAGIDFDVILQSPNAKQIIQSLPPQALYFGLKRQGLESSLEVLPHLTEDQVTRIVDYDVWYKDRLVPEKAFSLLKVFGEINSGELYRRFAYLDEEYQLSLLSGLLEVFDLEEFEAMSQEQQDRLYPMPCNQVYYAIKSANADTVSFVERLIDALKEHNLRYAYSILGHASFGLASENEESVRRFRIARMEEDGFVTYEDSLSCFIPIDHRVLRKKWSQEQVRKGAVAEYGEHDQDFLTAVLAKAQQSGWSVDEQYEIHQNLLFLSNSLCSASQVEPEDLHGINRVLVQCRALVSLGLDYLAQGNVELGLEILKSEHPKVLFRVAISLVQELRERLLKRLAESRSLPSVEEMNGYFRAGQWGQVLNFIDNELLPILGFEAAEILKGLFNRFPMTPEFGATQQNLRFLPLSSLSKLASLRDYVLGLSGLLFLTQIARKKTSNNLEIIINTALLSSLVKGEFVANDLRVEDIDEFLSLEEVNLKDKKETLFNFLMSSLVESSGIWDLSYESSISSGIHQTMKILASQYRSLIMAKENGQISNELVLLRGE